MSTVSTDTVIKLINEFECTRFTVGMLISSGYYVLSDTKIDKLADELSQHDKVFAFAVVDEKLKVQGVIVRKDLFDILGRRFGRELSYNKTALDMIQPVKVFNSNMHIFECSKAIEKDLNSGIQEYYALVDDNGMYKGLFSTRDMLMFLSRLTQQDIEQAKRVVNRIIKKEYSIRTKRLSILIKSEMVQDIGGDSYFVIPSKNKNEHIIAICDVAGKGIAASMVTTLISGMITTYDFDARSIENFLVHLNNYIYTTFEGEKFVTACFIVIDEDKGQLVLYDFGHSFVYLYRNQNIFKLSLKEINIPLGIQRITHVQSGRTTLHPLDCVLVITDGCIEQRNSICKEYGIHRLQKVFVNSYSDDLSQTVNAVLWDLEQFRGRYPQQDDITIACIRYE